MDALMNPEVIPTVIEYVFSLFRAIYSMATNAKGNKERCQEIANKVRSIERLVRQIQQSDAGEISFSVREALKDLCSTLESVKEWMMKFNQTKRFTSFLKSSSHEGKFNKLDKKLSDDLCLLSGALQIEQRDMMNRVYDTLSLRGPATSTAPTPTFTAPNPASLSTALVSPSTPMTPMPSFGPSNFPLDWNPGFLSGNPGFNRVTYQYQQRTLPHIGFTNDVLCGSVTQILTISPQTSGINPTQIMFPQNTSVISYVSQRSFRL